MLHIGFFYTFCKINIRKLVIQTFLFGKNVFVKNIYQKKIEKSFFISEVISTFDISYMSNITSVQTIFF